MHPVGKKIWLFLVIKLLADSKTVLARVRAKLGKKNKKRGASVGGRETDCDCELTMLVAWGLHHGSRRGCHRQRLRGGIQAFVWIRWHHGIVSIGAHAETRQEREGGRSHVQGAYNLAGGKPI